MLFIRMPATSSNLAPPSYNTRQKGVPYISSGAWVSYLADWLSLPAPLQLSLGVKYVDKRSADASSFGIPFGYVPSYTLWDAAVKYEQDHWKVQPESGQFDSITSITVRPCI